MKGPARTERFPFLLVMGVVVALAILAVATTRSVRHLEAQRAEERHLEEALADTERQVEELRRRIRRLREDPATLERLAREEMGLVRPGEVVVIFPKSAPEPESQVPGPRSQVQRPKP